MLRHGLTQAGDIIIEINGHRVYTATDIAVAIENKSPAKVTFLVHGAWLTEHDMVVHFPDQPLVTPGVQPN